MGIFSRFFGKDDEGAREARFVANPKIENPLSLQVLFADRLFFDPDGLARGLRSYHPSMARARCEVAPELSQKGTVFGLAGWGKHVIRLVGFDLPMPAQAVEMCVAPSHYAQELKERALSHRSHLLLHYAGYESEPLEQYVALAAVAGVLARFGAIVVLNEAAHTSFSATALSGEDIGGDVLEILRTLPLPILFCGFVKYDVEGIEGVWMRTYGAPLFGLPDFAGHAEGHHEGQKYFDMFSNMLTYLRESGASLKAGHTSQIGDEEFVRFRKPTEDEPFLDSESELLVTELIGQDDVKRPGS
jgi:hypothetical protein